MKKICCIIGITFSFILQGTFSNSSMPDQPYIPTPSTQKTESTTGSRYLIDKSVISEVLNLKKLQPIIRHIILKGNTRNNHNSEENKKEISVINLHRLY